MVDQPALALRRIGAAHFGDDAIQRFGIRADGAGERIAAKRAEADALQPRRLAGPQRQALVIDHDQRAVAINDRALFGEIKRHDRNQFRRRIIPDIALGPIRQREHAHRIRRA